MFFVEIEGYGAINPMNVIYIRPVWQHYSCDKGRFSFEIFMLGDEVIDVFKDTQEDCEKVRQALLDKLAISLM